MKTIFTPFRLVLMSGMVAMGVSGITAAAEAPSYDALDADQNGVISKAEAQSHPDLANRFGQMDADQSGELGWAEFARYQQLARSGDLPKDTEEAE